MIFDYYSLERDDSSIMLKLYDEKIVRDDTMCFSFIPGDGVISIFENLMVWNIFPVIFGILFYDLIVDLSKGEKNVS